MQKVKKKEATENKEVHRDNKKYKLYPLSSL